MSLNGIKEEQLSHMLLYVKYKNTKATFSWKDWDVSPSSPPKTNFM